MGRHLGGGRFEGGSPWYPGATRGWLRVAPRAAARRIPAATVHGAEYVSSYVGGKERIVSMAIGFKYDDGRWRLFRRGARVWIEAGGLDHGKPFAKAVYKSGKLSAIRASLYDARRVTRGLIAEIERILRDPHGRTRRRRRAARRHSFED